MRCEKKGQLQIPNEAAIKQKTIYRFELDHRLIHFEQ